MTLYCSFFFLERVNIKAFCLLSFHRLCCFCVKLLHTAKVNKNTPKYKIITNHKVIKESRHEGRVPTSDRSIDVTKTAETTPVPTRSKATQVVGRDQQFLGRLIVLHLLLDLVERRSKELPTATPSTRSRGFMTLGEQTWYFEVHPRGCEGVSVYDLSRA